MDGNVSMQEMEDRELYRERAWMHGDISSLKRGMVGRIASEKG